jgi:hypothetical protein
MDSARDVCSLAVNGVAQARPAQHDHERPALLVTDARGVIVEADGRASDLLGMSQPALAGKLLIAFVARQDTRAFRKHISDLARLAETYATFELRLRARGRTPFRATLTVSQAARPASGATARRYRWSVQPASSTLPADPALADVLRAVGEVAAGTVAGGPRPERSRVEIGAVVGATLVEHAAAADRRAVRLAVDGSAGSAAVLADEARLHDAVGGLLGAAIAAAAFGGEVRVRMARDADHAVLECSLGGPDPAHASFGSPLSLVLLAARLAADGARLEIAPPGGAPVLRARWPVSP